MTQILFEIPLPDTDKKVVLLQAFLTLHEIPFQQRNEPLKSEEKNTESKKLGRKGMQVLDLLSQGFTYAEIAKELEITIDGVRYYIKKIYKVLGVSNSAEAVRYYVKYLE